MNIKSLLLGSAAALAAVSGAQAADAIVAAEPEPLEYVRVCDAFGTGYFYIPGTETCLKVGGYVRAQVDGRSDFGILGSAGTQSTGNAQDGGYRSNIRGQFAVEAKNDTEFGTLASKITVRANTNDPARGTDFYLEETYLQLGGLRVGYFYNYLDNGLPGETVLSDGAPYSNGGAGGDTLNNSIRYTYDAGSFSVYGQVDAFNSQVGWKTDAAGNDDEIGVNGVITGKFGGVTLDFFAGYDFDYENAALASTLTAAIGPGSLGVFAAYSFGENRYFDAAEWTIGAEYAIKVTDKLSIAPGIQYWDNIELGTDGDFEGGRAWRAGITADYKITTNLAAKATVNYTDVKTGVDSDDKWDGFLRLQRSF
ncbi:porin [Agrobacterium sp. Ap1]|uniref:porin n=1 Tax=Agrobacterium sp. Ap1 TaxID=2815337 RepID=UPI001A90768F|nr:porin [Agrobacterium sp. Ap1]MBO0142498.1 porin [Agrobacterium sp. Ap1]